MNEVMRTHIIDTPAGRFVIYPGASAEDADSHKPLRWYYAPEGWNSKPYSKDYYSSQAAEEACWESLR